MPAAPHRAGIFIVFANLFFDFSPARFEPARQPDLHPRVVDDIIRRRVRDLNRIEHKTFGGHRHIAPTGRARAGILAIDVLIELKPETIQRIGAVVGVGDDLVGGQNMAAVSSAAWIL